MDEDSVYGPILVDLEPVAIRPNSEAQRNHYLRTKKKTASAAAMAAPKVKATNAQSHYFRSSRYSHSVCIQLPRTHKRSFEFSLLKILLDDGEKKWVVTNCWITLLLFSKQFFVIFARLNPDTIDNEPSKLSSTQWHTSTGVNLTKLFFFGNEEFFCVSLISLTISHKYLFFPSLQTLKLHSKNRKTGKMKVW